MDLMILEVFSNLNDSIRIEIVLLTPVLETTRDPTLMGVSGHKFSLTAC